MWDDESHTLSGNFYRVARFPTRNITTPIVLLYGGSDSLVDIDVMLDALPDHTIAEEVPHFEHLDFLWAREVDKLVIPRVVHWLSEYAEPLLGNEQEAEPNSSTATLNSHFGTDDTFYEDGFSDGSNVPSPKRRLKGLVGKNETRGFLPTASHVTTQISAEPR